jgi:hypothetical protein
MLNALYVVNANGVVTTYLWTIGFKRNIISISAL